MISLNPTHDPAARNWVKSANRADSDFPIQNRPFGIFRRRSSSEAFRGGVAIGDQILDLAAEYQAGVIRGSTGSAVAAAAQSTLNTFMALGPTTWSDVRRALFDGLRVNRQP
jgi:fumarylacetoacetase